MLHRPRPPPPARTAAPPPTAARPTRRDLLAAGLAAVFAPPLPAQAAEATAVVTEPPPPYALTIPSSWTAATEAAPPRSPFAPATSPTMLRVWFPSDAASPDVASITLKQAFAAADFTSLGSFGTPLAFGETLVSQMDRSRAGPDAPAARLISATSAVRDGAECYEIAYEVKRANETAWRSCYSVVALAFDGRFNMLYTLTGQVAPEGKGYDDAVKGVVASFVPPRTKS